MESRIPVMGGLNLFFDALPFLATVSPLIGAISVAAVSRWNAALARPVALSNASLTVLLLCATIWHYDPRRVDDHGRVEATQMEVSLGWLADPSPVIPNMEPPGIQGFDVRLSFAMDGLVLWPTLWLALAVWVAIWLPGERVKDSPIAYCCCLFLCEASLLGSLTARDAIVSAISFEMALPSLYFLVGTWGGDDRRSVAGRFLGWQLVGCGLMLLGTTLVVVSWPWMRSDLVAQRNTMSFDVPSLVNSLQALLTRSETAVQLWSDAAPWGLLLLLLGFAIRLPTFPFQSWYVSGLTEAPVGVAIVMAIGLPQAALCVWLRFAMPLFAGETSSLSGFLGIIGLLGALSAGLLAFAQRDLKKLVVVLSMGLLGLVLVGLKTPSRESLAGAWLLVQMQGLTVAVMFLWVEVLQTRFRVRDVDVLRGMAFHQPRLAALLMGTMGTLAFGVVTGLFLVLSAVVSESIVFAACALAVILLMFWVVLQTLVRCFCGRTADVKPAADDEPQPRTASSFAEIPMRREPVGLGAVEFVALAPFVVLLALINLAPAIVLDRSEPSLSKLLERIERSAAQPMSARQSSPALQRSNE